MTHHRPYRIRTLVLTAFVLTSIPIIQAGAKQIDACETTARWRSQAAPHSRVVIRTETDRPKEGKGCIRLDYNWRKAYAIFEPEIAWADHEAISFWLRFEGRKHYGWKLRISAEADNGGFTIWHEIDSNFDGWAHIRLHREDWQAYVLDRDKPMDWSGIRTFAFGIDHGVMGSGRPSVYIDDIRFEKTTTLAPTAEIPDTVVVSSCDSTNQWESIHLKVSAVADYKVEGSAAIQLQYEGITSGTASTAFTHGPIGTHHALAMSLRGPGAQTKATLTAVLKTRNGGQFSRILDIVNFEMREQLLFAGVFQTIAADDGTQPNWPDITEITFNLHNEEPNDSGNIVVDDIRFIRMAPPRPRTVIDERFWWWDGGFDPFAAMHVIHADWPHLESDPRPAVLKFSEFLLSPLMAYTIYLHNDGANGDARKFRVTITDWQTNVLKVLEIESPLGAVTSHDLVTPPRTGTYIFNVECLDADDQTVATYQTGITVLAKRLGEPKGIWGLHGYIGSKGSNWPHHPQVLRMLRATGVMVLRERIAFMKHNSTQQIEARRSSQGRVLQLAKTYQITTVATAMMRATPHLWVDGRYEYGGIVPGKEQEVFDTMVSLTETYKGLVDWWEIGNEPNEHPLAPYANILATCYRAAKKADPKVQVVMGGSHVLDRWQYQAWQLERNSGIPHQDALATHLYPDPYVLETTMRSWIADQGHALIEKGMLMTEAGWPTFPAKTIALYRQGLLPQGYSGEHVSQDWYMRYAPLILGEHMKVGADLHGVCFFRSTPSMGDWVFKQSHGEILVNSKGHFVAQWGNRQITMGRPMAYTHNTIARLLTHDISPTEISLDYDRTKGKIEHYAFKRPGEIVVPLWIGVYAGMRAEWLTATIALPSKTGLVLSCDMDGNERVVPVEGGRIMTVIKRGQPRYLRLIDGLRQGPVFAQIHGLDQDSKREPTSFHLVTRDSTAKAILDKFAAAGISHAPKDHAARINIYAGTPHDRPKIPTMISRDRNLPTTSNVVPALGRPMVLYSPKQRSVFVVGQSDQDVVLASDILLDQIAGPATPTGR